VGLSEVLSTTPSKSKIDLIIGRIYFQIVLGSLHCQKGFVVCWVQPHECEHPQIMLKLRRWGNAIVLPHHLPCLHYYLCKNTEISTKLCIFRGTRKQCTKRVASPSHHPLPLRIDTLYRNLSYPHGKKKKDVRNKATGERNDALN
jgi:hypothetical protein